MSVLFNGSPDKITTTTGAGYANAWPFSFAAVIKLTATAASRAILSHNSYDVGGFWYSFIDTDDTLLFVGNSIGVQSTVAVPTGVWVFVGYGGATASSHRLYCYNYETAALVFDETSTNNISTVADVDKWVIGARRPTATTYEAYFEGQISWLAYYQQNMTSANFATMRASGPNAVVTPNVLWGFVDSPSGGSGTLLDDAQNNDNGTLVGFTFDSSDGWRVASPYDTWRASSATLMGAMCL